MSPLTALLMRRFMNGGTASRQHTRSKRRRAGAALGRGEQLERRAMFAVTSVVDPLGVAGWAGAFAATAVESDATVNAVASDSAGNRYVGGYFYGTVDFDPGAAVVTKTVATATGYVAKFGAAGNLLSVITLDVAPTVGGDNQGSSSVAALAISGNGRIAIAGDYAGEVDFNPSSAVNKASGFGAFAVVLGTDWSWQGSLITFNDVGAGTVEASVTHVAFVEDSPTGTNTNLYLGGWAANQSVDAFVLKTSFSDADRTDWVRTLGGTDAEPAGMVATSTGVVVAATYTGSLAAVNLLAPNLTLPSSGGIAISLRSDGTSGPGSWVQSFPQQTPFETPSFDSRFAVMPMAVSPDGATVYVATTTDDGTNASTTIHAIKNTGTAGVDLGSILWSKTSGALFGTQAPAKITAQALALSNGNLFVGGTAISTVESLPQIGLTALDPATGTLKGTAILASGSANGRVGTVTADGRVLFGGTFSGSAGFPTLAATAASVGDARLVTDVPTEVVGFAAAVANPFLVAPQFETFSRPIAALPEGVSANLGGAITTSFKSTDPFAPEFSTFGIPISAFRLTRNGTDIPLTNRAVAELQNVTPDPGGQSASGRVLKVFYLDQLTSSPGTYVLSFDPARMSEAERAKVSPVQAGATIGTASATYTIIDPAIVRMNALFRETWYLVRYPDVAAAVRSGAVPSARWHFDTFGLNEGRSPNPIYDEAFYLTTYPDVAAAVRSRAFPSGLAHFLVSGIPEGRQPSLLCNERTYLAANRDVAAAVGPSKPFRSGMEHLVLFGQAAGRRFSPLYEEAFYLQQNADIAAVVGTGKAFGTGFEHFVLFGQSENRAFSRVFDQRTYLALNQDLAGAVGAGKPFRNGIEHFLWFGLRERRRFTAAFAESFYLSSNPDVAAAVGPGKPFASGFQHFVSFGFARGRRYSPGYDEAAYLALNPDVSPAVGPTKAFRTGLEHYLLHGQFEGRRTIVT